MADKGRSNTERLYMDYGQAKDSLKVLPGTSYCLILHRPTIHGLYIYIYSGQKGQVDELQT